MAELTPTEILKSLDGKLKAEEREEIQLHLNAIDSLVRGCEFYKILNGYYAARSRIIKIASGTENKEKYNLLIDLANSVCAKTAKSLITDCKCNGAVGDY